MLKHVLAGALLLMAAVMAAGGGEFARGPLAAGDAEGNVALAQAAQARTATLSPSSSASGSS